MLEKLNETEAAVLCADNGALDPATGAVHRFALIADVEGTNADSSTQVATIAWLSYQSGNPMEFGRNGFFLEDLIETMLHRLNGFQRGPHACVENVEAIAHLEAAKRALDSRQERLAAERAAAPKD